MATASPSRFGNGLVSAKQAGISVVITRNIYFRDDDFSDAIATLDERTELTQ